MKSSSCYVAWSPWIPEGFKGLVGGSAEMEKDFSAGFGS